MTDLLTTSRYVLHSLWANVFGYPSLFRLDRFTELDYYGV